MAFMTPTATASYEERVPIISYHSPSGRLFLIDRVQRGEEWETVKTDITMTQPQFAVDFGRVEAGWAFFQEGQAPKWTLSFYGQVMPPQPPSPGNDNKGKALQFKAAFRVPVMGSQIGGIREFGGNANVLINGINELHTAFESAPEAAAGKIPLVKMTNSVPVKAGQSTNFQPVFTIQAWVDRPAALGDRAVAPPSVANTQAHQSQTQHAQTSTQVPPTQNGHVPPPATAQATQPVPDAMPF